MSRRALLLTLGLLGLVLVAVVEAGANRPNGGSITGTGLPGWRQVNEDGFGDPNNGQVPSLAVFDGYLYAGTWNDRGGTITFQIWRTADGLDWEQVASELGNGAAHLMAFDGLLYAGTWDGAVWRSPDGLAWTAVITDGFGDPNNGINRLSVFGDMLYATTWNASGTEVWRTADGTTWDQLGDDGLGDAGNVGAIASEVLSGALYFGTGNWDTGAQLWKTDGVTLTCVVTGGFGSANNAAISSLATFSGSLYAGTWNESGVEVWRSPDGESWEQVVGGGFGNPAACRENALEVHKGHLYLVVQNYDAGLEVWRTSNGTDWEQVGSGGFGDSLNIWSYWDNATTVFGGSLYIATNHAYTGGEVWRMVEHRVHLPLVTRNYTPAETEITIWHSWGGDYLQEYQDIVDEFNLAHPSMVVQLVYVEDLVNALVEAIPAGTGPDVVFFTNEQIGALALSGLLVPLDTWVELSYLTANFEPAAVKAVMWDEQIWGIPDTQEGIALVYNRDLISDTQVPARDDWNGLLTEAAQFRQAHPEQFYLCDQGLGDEDAYHVAPIYFGHGLNEYGGYVDEDGIVYMTTTAAISAAHWISDFRPYAPAGTSYEICKNMLINEEAAIWWTGPWAIADLEAAGIDYGIAPMGSPFVGVRLYMLTPNAEDRGNAEAAVYVIKYLGSAEVQRRLTLANGTIPANTAALNDPDVQALYKVAQFGASVNLGTPMGNHIYTQCQWGPVGDATMAIWNGSQTPEEAMNAAQAAMEDCVDGMGAATGRVRRPAVR